MSAHTPGPWRATPDSFVMTSGKPSLGIARIITHIREFEANARLIAAAPDLLEAAKAVLPYFDQMWPPEDATGGRGRFREALRVSIAKAEGRS